mmetsp:Transcript_15365/g.23131  ORF Transcript_15365/g.23131 Transcript_15365/m.23131 type:complete len:222 (+) Transcript_15365:207-872(+)|eukprot:CAMPEP_0185028056 /NCGR_PEP_ID=MMETSP1103-20130426/13531_1 /TAXON_ID=36769 /ORGANISM="Paraphysomonas bandaiensis, Strain Caron Lab Isolate" /LENGTH=221 /DNA_ID=CAMNT_0027562303 /DNA_START=120 /DNA_END=785 /DNA_ORIENTATION=+
MPRKPKNSNSKKASENPKRLTHETTPVLDFIQDEPDINAEYIEKEPDVIRYDDYKDDIEVGVVYNNIDSRMLELSDHEGFMLKRVAVGLAAILSCLLGIFLVLLGRAETDVFQSQPKIIALEVFGYLLCIPFIVWFVFAVCPSKQEYLLRRRMQIKRRNRLQPYETKQITQVGETAQQREARILAEKRQAYLDEEARIQKMKSNKARGISNGREVDRFFVN